MIPPLPPVFAPVWLGVAVLCGWVAWRTQREVWMLVALVWLVVVGPLCWFAVGAALS